MVGVQGLILFMVATSKEEVPAVPPPKRALLWYPVLDFFLWSFPLSMFFLIKFGIPRFEYVFLPSVLLVGIGIGLFAGYGDIKFFLKGRIRDGVVENIKDEGWWQSRLPALIALVLFVVFSHGGDALCQTFFQSGEFQCFGEIKLLVAGLFFGTHATKIGWILRWERLNQRKLYLEY